MWRCVNCGARMANGVACTACGRPFDAAVEAIGKKVWRVRYFNSVTRRWTLRGAAIGFLVGILLSPAFIAIVFLRPGFAPRNQSNLHDMSVLLPFLAPIILSFLFGKFAFVLATVVRPVCVALFCSPERFEEEYGPFKR